MVKVLTKRDEDEADRHVAIVHRKSPRAAILYILRTLKRDADHFPDQSQELVRMAPINIIDCLERKQHERDSVEDLAVIVGFMAVHGRLPTANEIAGITFDSSADYFARKYPEDIQG